MGVTDSLTPDSCFHCGLPNNNAGIRPLEVQGVARQFCCHGCRSVCDIILHAGLEQYYDHRTEKASSQATLDEIDSLSLYDQADIKRQFVLEHEGFEEACLLLEDIHCSACVWLNEHHLRQLKGVVSVSIDSVSHRALIRWDPDQIALSKILLAIRDIGYQAYPFDPVKNQQQLENRREKSTERLLFSGIFGMFVMQFSIATYFMGVAVVGGEMQSWELGGRWLSLFFSFLLLAYPGQIFFVGAWRAIRRRTINMDVPIALGLGAAFLGSSYAMFTQQGAVYFDAIAMFVFFILLSRRYELKGQLYAARFLSRLNKQKIISAELIAENGATRSVVVSELKQGDVIRVLPGAILPIDGVLASERAEIDESVLTGESLPQMRMRGEMVYAGGVNGDQPILVNVLEAGAYSSIDQINRLVLRAQDSKSEKELLINRVASGFVTAILLITLASMAFWLWMGSASWLSNTISVLIVTCPCALALAIPVANSITAGRLLEQGILPLNIQALNQLANAQVAVFDKTGTLTRSELVLVAQHYETPALKAEILDLIRQMAAQSEHPVAQAIKREFGKVDAVSMQVLNLPGQGLSAGLAGKELRLGALDFAYPEALKHIASRRKIEQWQQKGYQIVAFKGATSQSTALFAFSNPARQGAKQMIDDVRHMGVKDVVIASGDHHENVERLAGLLGVDQFFARLRPADKLELVKKRKRAGQCVLMVGDGMNDAPTLAAADVSISLASGTDLAKVNCDFVLLGDDISKVTQLINIARDTQKIIRQNIYWAVGYNLFAVPFAVAGFIQPWMAALGMSMSALLVVSNALRLSRTEQDPSHTASLTQDNEAVDAPAMGAH